MVRLHFQTHQLADDKLVWILSILDIVSIIQVCNHSLFDNNDYHQMSGPLVFLIFFLTLLAIYLLLKIINVYIVIQQNIYLFSSSTSV